MNTDITNFQFLITISSAWASLLFFIGFIAIYRSGAWLQTLKLRKEKGCWAFFKKTLSMLSIFNKPMLTTYDFWSDIALCLEMIAFGAKWPLICSVCVLSVHSIASSAFVYFDSRQNKCRRGFLQLINALIFWETYESVYAGYGKYELQELRILEVCFESCPQALIQLYFAIEYIDDYSTDPLFLISIIATIVSLTFAVHFLDCYGLASKWKISFCGCFLHEDNSSILKMLVKLVLFSTRCVEVLMRLFLISFVADATETRITYFYIASSAVVVFLYTFLSRCWWQISTMSIEEILANFQICLLNVYFFHWENEGVFFWTNCWKCVETATLLMIALTLGDVSPLMSVLLISLPLVFGSLCVFILSTRLFDKSAFRNARDQDFEALVEARHFELLVRLLKRGRVGKKLEGKHVRYLKQNGLALSTFRQFHIDALAVYNGGFEPTEMKNAGYTALEMKSFCEAKELRTFGFTAFDLYDAFFTIRDLQAAGYPDSDIASIQRIDEVKRLREDGKRASKICEMGYTAHEALEADFSPNNVLSAGFPLRDLKNANFTVQDFRKARFKASDVRLVDYNIVELLDGGYSREEVLDAGFTPRELRSHFTVEEIRKANYEAWELCDSDYYTIEELFEGGYSRKQVAKVGFPPRQLRDAGYTVTDFYSAGRSGFDAQSAGFDVKELRDAGYSQKEILNAGFGVSKMRSAGFTLKQLQSVYSAKDLISCLHSDGYQPKQLREVGYKIMDLINAECTLKDIHEAGYSQEDILDGHFFDARSLHDIGYSLLELRNHGYSIQDVKKCHFNISQILKAGWTLQEVIHAGYSPEEISEQDINILNAGLSASEAREAGFSIQQVCDATYDKNEVLQAGFNVRELLNADYSIAEIQGAGYLVEDYYKMDYTIKELLDFGFEMSDVSTAGYSIRELQNSNCDDATILKAGFPASELREAQFKAKQLLTQNYSVMDLADASFSVKELRESGVSPHDLRTAGFSILQLKQLEGFTILEQLEAGFTIEELLSEYSTAEICAEVDIADAGLSAFDAKNLGFCIEEVCKANYRKEDILRAGFTIKELRSKDNSNSEIKRAGYSMEDFYNADYDINQLVHLGFDMNDAITAGYSLRQLQEANCDVETILNAKFSASSLRDAHFTASQLYKSGNYSAQQLIDAGFSVKEIRDAGVLLREFQKNGVSISRMKLLEAGYTIWEVASLYSKEAVGVAGAGVSVSDGRKSRLSMKQIREINFIEEEEEVTTGGFTINEFPSEGSSNSKVKGRNTRFSVEHSCKANYLEEEIFTVGSTIEELPKKPVSKSEIENERHLICQEFFEGGYEIQQLVDLGFDMADISKGGYSVRQLQEANCDDEIILNAGFSASELRDAQFNAVQLYESGSYSERQLTDAGFSAKEIQDATKNNAALPYAASTPFSTSPFASVSLPEESITEYCYNYDHPLYSKKDSAQYLKDAYSPSIDYTPEVENAGYTTQSVSDSKVTIQDVCDTNPAVDDTPYNLHYDTPYGSQISITAGQTELYKGVI